VRCALYLCLIYARPRGILCPTQGHFIHVPITTPVASALGNYYLLFLVLRTVLIELFRSPSGYFKTAPGSGLDPGGSEWKRP
jgi:hypothetical protein